MVSLLTFWQLKSICAKYEYLRLVLTAEKAGLGVIIVNIKRYHKVVCIVVALFCKSGFKMRKTMISKQLLKKRLLRLNFIGYFLKKNRKNMHL